jgi:hypothetical protein
LAIRQLKKTKRDSHIAGLAIRSQVWISHACGVSPTSNPIFRQISRISPHSPDLLTHYPHSHKHPSIKPSPTFKMSDEAKPTPSADHTASAEPRVAQDETKLATNPQSTESKPTMAETATNAASTVASTATAAATGVKDSVFSMFGGGAKKEKKVEEDDVDEPSGSSKAKKADDDEEVGNIHARLRRVFDN